MQLEVAVKFLLADDVVAVRLHHAAVQQLESGFAFAIELGPVVEAFAVEEDDGSFGRRRRLHVHFVLRLGDREIADIAVLGRSKTGANEQRQTDVQAARHTEHGGYLQERRSS